MSDLRICHIEDDIIFALAVNKMFALVSGQIEISHFFNGKEAVDYLNTIDVHRLWPHILLLDISMPVMDGWEFLDYWSSLSPELTIRTQLYIVTSSNESDDVSRAKDFPFVKDYLVKPLFKKDLTALIADYFVMK